MLVAELLRSTCQSWNVDLAALAMARHGPGSGKGDVMLREAADAAWVQDAVLTRAAPSGEVAALGVLLERHRAGMRAVALSLLGAGTDVDDVLQDAALTALLRIGDVRD